MTQEEKSEKVVDFLAKTVQQLPYFIDNDIMDSFEVTFKHNGKNYQFALIKEGKVKGKLFEICLN